MLFVVDDKLKSYMLSKSQRKIYENKPKDYSMLRSFMTNVSNAMNRQINKNVDFELLMMMNIT
jgi:hypothetical protein